MSFTADQLVIFAARAGNVSLLEERVRAGGDINHVDAKHGSALAEAVHTGNLDVLDWLLSNGVDVNVQYQDRIGPLELALRHPDPQVVYQLVSSVSSARLNRYIRDIACLFGLDKISYPPSLTNPLHLDRVPRPVRDWR